MRIVAFVSQKGGVGKTTLAGHLAVEAEKQGAGPVALLDTDPQGSLASWWNVRTAETPIFVRGELSNLKTQLDQLAGAGVGLVIIDTPPAITENIASVVRQADLVVIPTRPSPMTFAPSARPSIWWRAPASQWCLSSTERPRGRRSPAMPP